jgi:hypothetical protein
MTTKVSVLTEDDLCPTCINVPRALLTMMLAGWRARASVRACVRASVRALPLLSWSGPGSLCVIHVSPLRALSVTIVRA